MAIQKQTLRGDARAVGRSADEEAADVQALTPRQAERRRRILEAVRRLIGDLGFANLNMRDVAAEAGVAHATLYNLFESKDGLVLAALRDNLDRIANSGGMAGLSALERYFKLLAAVTERIVESPRYAEAMTHLMFNAAPSDGVTRLLVAQRIVADRNAVREMIREGWLVPELDADACARRLTGAFWSAMLLWMKGFVALHDLPREIVTAHRAVLAVGATEAGSAWLGRLQV